VQRVRLSLGADVTETGKRSDCDYVGIRHARNVAGKASVTAALSGLSQQEDTTIISILYIWRITPSGHDKREESNRGCGWKLYFKQQPFPYRLQKVLLNKAGACHLDLKIKQNKKTKKTKQIEAIYTTCLIPLLLSNLKNLEFLFSPR